MVNGNMDSWSDRKKWQMDLVSKLILAIAVAIVAAFSAKYIDQRFKIELAQRNAELQNKLAINRFSLNRLETRSRSLENLSNEFVKIAYQYAVALDSAFNDIYYNHQRFNAGNKGANQIRYEIELLPIINALADQLVKSCDATTPAIVELRKLSDQAFKAYDFIEDKKRDAVLDESWKPYRQTVKKAVPLISQNAIAAFVLVDTCLEDIARSIKED
ncbi:MAG: hypothetical protein AAF431_04180 [Pseudomonadota bacterium]